MSAKYLLIQGNKKAAKQALIDGWFFTWTAENLKNAFSFGNGTIDDFRRFARDNAGNSTHIDLETLTYIDTGKPANIDRETVNRAFSLYHIEEV